MVRGSNRKTRLLRAAAAACVLAAAMGQLSRTAQAQAACGLDMRVLVISADGSEADLPAIKRSLDYLGTSYDVYIASQSPGGLTADRLSAGCHANYQAVIVTTGNVDNNWSGVLSLNELQALRTFETQFKVRQVVWYTFPNDFGLVFDSTVNTMAQPMTVSLTAAGAALFPYINRGPQKVKVGKKTVTVGNAARPLAIEQATAYLAEPDAASTTTPLILDPAGHTLATVTTTNDGREVLAMTFDSNAYSLQTLLFGYGIINWATRGLFLGERHVYLSPQIDDVFLADDRWLPGNSCTLVGKDQGDDDSAPSVRMTGKDLAATALWQRSKNVQPLFADLQLTLAFNGWGTTGVYKKDTLTPAAKVLDPLFYWVSHTYDHPMLDGIGYAAAKSELTMNSAIAKKLKLANFSATSLVTPNVSGLSDPEVMQAVVDTGIKYVVTDTSIAGQDNPYPNVGIYNWSQPKLLMIPRRPVNLFYNVSTPAEWTAEYNCIYNSYFGRDLTYAEILDFVSNQLLPYLLLGESDPWMFHQPNLVAYDGKHSLLSDLLDLTLAKYSGYFTVPIVSPSMDQLGVTMASRMAWLSANVRATLQPGVSLTLSADRAVTVPVTGLSMSGAESYGGGVIGWVKIPAGRSVVVPVPARP